jgi:hypothetical protein
MKRAVTGFVCAWVLINLAGCSSNYAKAEEATKEMLGALNDIIDALESVKNKETAKAAAPKIEAAVDRMQAAKNKADTIKGTQADKEKLEKEYLPKLAEAQTRMQKAALSAGLKCEQEPTFMKAIEKMSKLK